MDESWAGRAHGSGFMQGRTCVPALGAEEANNGIAEEFSTNRLMENTLIFLLLLYPGNHIDIQDV